MPIDFDAICALVPEQRADELKKIIEDLTREIDERQEDLEEAQRLLTLCLEEQVALNVVRNPTPASLEEDFDEDVEGGDLESVAAQAPRQDLEDVVQARPPTPQEALYSRTEERPIAELYQELRGIYDREAATGVQTEQDRERLYELQRGLSAKREDIESGEYKPDERAAHLLTTAERILKDMYKGTVQENDPSHQYR